MPDLDPTQPREEPGRRDNQADPQTKPAPARQPTPAATGSYPGLSSASTIPELFQPPTSADEIGRVGDYRILKALGEGGMGAVFLAEDTRLQRQVALKFLLPILATSEHGRVRFLREARAAARIRHENVVIVYDVDEVRGLPFIAMELLKGATLDTFLKKKGPQLLERVVRVGK